ncbi:N-acetyltransferase family protein [Aspergillus luchuensis]|uniref:N-acetyltransferase family protein n=1 Tax=Aspergillus kawachii TaxID=1069201 RepID=A0A146FJP1_ASPKA|nr:N-acetyltransferase family protein [Aspergillus luchuensis]
MASNTYSYTPDQLTLYLERIHYGSNESATSSSRLQQAQQAVKADPLGTLYEIQRRHLASIPWGNSALHYSNHRTIDIRPACVYEKLITRRLDGYCMENNTLLYWVLKSLGYAVYATGGRVCLAATGQAKEGLERLYTGMSHMVLIVLIEGEKYAVDVGFGGNGPTRPLPLKEDVVSVCMAPTEMRLVHEPLPEYADQTQKVWIYQIRYTPDSRWIPMYSFLGTEFLPQDFEIMNYATSQRPTSWFTQSLVCTRFIMDEAETEVQGMYFLVGREVKKRQFGKTEVVETLERDADRVKALEKWFDMHLRDYEVEAIRGFVSEIK